MNPIQFFYKREMTSLAVLDSDAPFLPNTLTKEEMFAKVPTVVSKRSVGVESLRPRTREQNGHGSLATHSVC